MRALERVQPLDKHVHGRAANTETTKRCVSGRAEVSTGRTSILALGHGQHGAELVLKDAVWTTDDGVDHLDLRGMRLDGMAHGADG